MISPQENKHASASPRTIAVNSRSTIVIKSSTTHNEGYENPLTQQQVSSRKASALEVESLAASPVRECVELCTNAEGAGRARRKRTHVEYSEDAQEAQAVRRAAAEEARRRRTQGQTGVRVGRKFQAVVPDWERGEALDRNDELLSKAHMSCGEELSA